MDRGSEWVTGGGSRVHLVTAATATITRVLDELTDVPLYGLVPEAVGGTYSRPWWPWRPGWPGCGCSSSAQPRRSALPQGPGRPDGRVVARVLPRRTGGGRTRGPAGEGLGCRARVHGPSAVRRTGERGTGSGDRAHEAATHATGKPPMMRRALADGAASVKWRTRVVDSPPDRRLVCTTARSADRVAGLRRGGLGVPGERRRHA